MRMKDKSVLITGAGSGLGEATARRLAEEGAKLVLCDLHTGASNELAAQLPAGQAIVRACDVTDENAVSAAVDQAVEVFGKLDGVFHSAGIVGAVGPIATTPGDEWRFSIDVLLNGTFYVMKHAARVMVPNKSGSIVSMASTAGVMGGLGPHAYAAAKHGVVGLTKNVAAELAGHGIRVNSIAAASMATPMVANVLTGDPNNIEETIAQLAAMSPLRGRAGLSEDVANAVLWLLSDESGYTTGHTLTTDAGITVGATTQGPAFAEYAPIIREAGKTGMGD